MSARIVPPTPENIRDAAERLRSGKLVAFPTETVYGLGANALDADAVARIFAAKGRPATNPLIVHVADTQAAKALCADWTPVADELAAMYWAGAVTLVVRKTDAVPNIVTAGGDTVALRVPDHPVALELLRAAGVPVAAPSANRSESVSPTTAQHVADSLADYVDDLLILDGGACAVGIESTVVDATGQEARVLRPGMVAVVYAPVPPIPPTPFPPATEEKGGVRSPKTVGFAGSPTSTDPETPPFSSVAGGKGVGGTPTRSPGQAVRHYAPNVPLHVLTAKQIRKLRQNGDVVIGREVVGSPPNVQHLTPNTLLLPATPHGYAAGLYAAFRTLEVLPGVARILVEEPPKGARWDAIHDRLKRAASPLV